MKHPLKENVYFMNCDKPDRKSAIKLNQILIASFLLLFGLSTVAVGTFLLIRIKNLEIELENLKSVVDKVKVLDDDFLDSVSKFPYMSYDDLLGDDYNETEAANNEFIIKPDTDYYEDYDNSDDNVDSMRLDITKNEEIDDKQVENDLTTSQFLKKLKPIEMETTSDYPIKFIDDLKIDYFEENDAEKNSINKQASNKNTRNKRDIIAATSDGVLINPDSNEEHKRKNLTEQHISTKSPKSVVVARKQQDFTYNPLRNTLRSTVSPVLGRKSHDKSKAFRQLPKKSFFRNSQELFDSSVTSSNEENSPKTFHLRARADALNFMRIGRIKPLPSGHFNGDTSKYVYGVHTNYNGNGHLRHPSKTYVDWKATEWMTTLDMTDYFQMLNGIVTIKDSGIYLVYAQIYYLDEHDMNGFRVFKNDQMILQCVTSTHTEHRVNKGNTCYTMSVEYLKENDKVHIADISEDRYSLFEPGKSFFGFVKLGDHKPRL